MEYKKLYNGVDVPMVGMGGWAQKESEILKAFEFGYRLIDTAAQYGNESEVGQAILHSGLSRKDIFVTTKLWNDDVRSGKVREAFEKSLDNLGLDYVDLYLIHYPADGYMNAWEELNRLYEEGIVRCIGVSNFQPHHIDDLLDAGLMLPMVNQIEEHPYFSNGDVVTYCNNKKIAVEAWCPLGGPRSGILNDEVINELAVKYKKTSAQIILRWQFQRGIISIPKSTNTIHMRTNMEIFDFSLNLMDMELIDKLNKNARLGANPDNFNF